MNNATSMGCRILMSLERVNSKGKCINPSEPWGDPSEHGEPGDYAASGISSTSKSGYQRWNMDPNSRFNVFTGWVATRRGLDKLVSSSLPLRTGLATLVASGSLSQRTCTKRSFQFLSLPRCSPVDSLRVREVSLFRSSRRLYFCFSGKIGKFAK